MPRPRGTRLFFVADLHGSDVAYRKLVNAAGFYDADALVIGGDLMGKQLVPIVRVNGAFRARFSGQDHAFDAAELPEFTAALARAGAYWRAMDPDEYAAAAADPLLQEGVFQEEAVRRLADWMAFAEERLAGTRVHLYLMGGNDDAPAVLTVLDEHDGPQVVACEGRLVDLDGEHSMISIGWSTPTPWDTAREADEDEIAAMIEGELVKVPDDSRCVFNFHCPPKDTPIDVCLRMEPADGGLGPGDLPRPDRSGGRFHYIGGGSRAVRDAIERRQPLVGLHGHIHESGGRFRIGRTQCFNPGSEYAQGVLQGWIVTLRGGRLQGYQHTSG